MARATACICSGCQKHAGYCGQPTLNGSRCVPCNRGFRRTTRNPAYDTLAWRARRARDLAEARARPGGGRCSRCGRREDPADRSTRLSLGHRLALALGGSLLGPTDVICGRCNTRQRLKDTPTRRR